jgi:hypothetical protein
MSGRDAHLATLRLKRKQLRLSWCGLGHRLMSDHLDPQGGLALAVDFGSPSIIGDLASSNKEKSEDLTNAAIVAAVGILAGCAAVVATCSTIVCRAHRGRAAGRWGCQNRWVKQTKYKKKKKKKKS